MPPPHSPSGVPSPSLFLREDALKRGVELILRAQAALGDAANDLLAKHELGKAHHRALIMIARNPGLSLTDLQHLLRVRKQSLAPITDHLVAKGLLDLRPASRDRRMRLATLTEKGRDLEQLVFATIRDRMANAYRHAGPKAVGGFWDVLTALAGEDPIDHEG
ncbi:MarR family transcriptional regulator [Iodidimonas muriae]|uniref:MarR family transcriptional regulator n=2 Tax=Iodidimonas muriae TaxID=261467 RepID=A0ABQ2LED8_9PROT|nr:MarR family transcriptional regulator [Kordiimonadales bacterium JCM 17843]GGO13675.1 MarR family transcriptional regulator [Iodidimonas muriae]